MKKLRWGGLLALLVCLLLLCACDGNPLPQGMEEETLLDQGREIVQLLNEGNYDAIYDQMRQDGQETTSVEDIQSYFQAVLDEAGAYKRESDCLATGQKLDSGEEYGTAVLYCKHEKKNVVYRIAFDTDMALMGLQVQAE